MTAPPENDDGPDVPARATATAAPDHTAQVSHDITRGVVYAEFNMMYAHPDIVGSVIASSYGDSPPSLRRKVMAAIHEHRNPVGTKDPAAIGRHGRRAAS
jgi:hypothetical protein